MGGGGGGGREVQQISRDFDNPLNVRLQPKQKKKITDMKKEGERKREKETEKCFFFGLTFQRRVSHLQKK